MPKVDNITKNMEKLNGLLQKERKPVNIRFKTFLELIAENPQRSMRSIFQLFHDMIHYYIPQGINEYPNDPESINYIQYDCSKLFQEDAENPYFADRLFANRLINVVDSLKEGVVRNKMLLFVGPPGSGKSTFLNNLIEKLENYTELEDGVMYESVWQIDTEKFGFPFNSLDEAKERKIISPGMESLEIEERDMFKFTDRFLVIPCPSHDHPIIQIPKQYRRDFLDGIIEDRQFKRLLFNHKEYEWIFNDSPCPICSSLYKALSEKFSWEEILNMLYARRYEFSRKLGDGVSVYNPGDRVLKNPIYNDELQKWINALFKTSDAVTYLYSRMAKTNNGVFSVMDVKVNNVDRIKNLHGIISDGIHKVGTFEETTNSLFITLVNPEDISVINEEKSFRDRVIRIPIPYIRDYMTEVEIYRNVFGGGIDEYFLPRILRAFARTIVSTRLNANTEGMKEWISNPTKYSKYCDKNLLLLKMEIYTGMIPEWLEEEDVKKLDRKLRRKLILIEGDDEGNKGISGRESLEMFNSFYSTFRNRDDLINMDNLQEFFKNSRYKEKIPDDFLPSLESLYDYNVLQEVKEAMFYYNQDQISNDIADYLFAVNHDIGADVECPYTSHKLDITEDYFAVIESRFMKPKASSSDRKNFRNETLKHYVAKTLHEIKSGADIKSTQQFEYLMKKYYQSLKENVLSPFASNDNFRRAIKDYRTDTFKNYDKRIKDEVKLLIKNLAFKFNYTEKGAKQVCIHVIDKDLVNKYSG
jgi:DNA polymerase III delta prime subunit